MDALPHVPVHVSEHVQEAVVESAVKDVLDVVEIAAAVV